MAFARRLLVLLAFAAGVFAPAAHAAPFISMYVSPATIDVGGTSVLEINIYDCCGGTISGGQIAGFTYPAGVLNSATPNPGSDCGASLTAAPGTNSLAATGINIPFNQVCTIQVQVTSAAPALYTISFPPGTFSGSTGSNSTNTTTNLAVTPPLVVTTTLDSGPGSLRQVIQDSKDTCASLPVIRFNIVGAGPHTIQPPTELPTLTCPGTTIDGYSQPGSQVNSMTDGTNNAVIKVAIDGSLCSGCNRALAAVTYSSIQGLAIHSFPLAHIESTQYVQVYGSYIGTDPGGMSALGGEIGIRVIQGNAQIGVFIDPAQANLITGHQKGVMVEDANANIDGNLIGGNRAGTGGIGNSVAGVWIHTLGSDTYINNNFIRYNGGPGIAIEAGNTARNSMPSNAMSGNAGPGIDLKIDGPTPNDESAFPYDQDNGPNLLMNYAVLTSVTHVGGDTVLQGYLKTECCGGYAFIDFYHNSAVPPAGITQGEKPIGSINVNLDEFGFAAFNHTIPGFLAQNVSTTALVDYCGDGCQYSSEYSPTYAVGGGGPVVTFTPASLNFPARTVSSTSPPQTVTVTNNGPGALAISSITISGDFAFVSACPASLPVDATCTIGVTFTPLVAGLRIGSLNVVSNAGASPHSLALAGTGQGGAVAVLDISPSVLDFAPQALDSESPVQIVTLGNAGTAVLAFGPFGTNVNFVIRPVPPPAPGATPRPPGYVGQCDTGLAPGETCDVAIAFRPIAEGLWEGVLSISSNATQPTATVRLVGTGIVGVPPRTLSIAQSVAFAAQAVGTRSVGTTVTISNNSATTVAITELTVTGDFSVSDTCAIIPANGSCSLLMAFEPTAEGERTGSLTIRALAETDPYSVSLMGTGVFNPVPALKTSVTRVGFGNSLFGSAPPVDIALVNIGQVAVALGAISATGDFLVSHGCGSALAVGASCSVQVRFFPLMLGPRAGTLEVASNAAGSPHRVELSGIGCAIPSSARSRLRPILCAP